MSKRLIQTKLSFSSSQPEPVNDTEKKHSLKRKLSDSALDDNMDDSRKPIKTYAAAAQSTSHGSTYRDKPDTQSKGSDHNRVDRQARTSTKGQDGGLTVTVSNSSAENSHRRQAASNSESGFGKQGPSSSFQQSVSRKSDVDSHPKERAHKERHPSPDSKYDSDKQGKSGHPGFQRSISQKSDTKAYPNQARYENSSGESDDDQVSRNIETYKPKPSHDGSGSWRGVPINALKRAPECFKKVEMSLPELKPSSDHKVFFEIPTGGWKNEPLKSYCKNHHDTWNDEYVYMPYSEKNEVSENGKISSRWERITMALTRNITGSFELEDAIFSYNPHYQKRWNFDALHTFFEETDDGVKMRDTFFAEILPKMQELALRLPELCPKAIPILKQRKKMKLTLSQQQVACLLANAFFCTFPKRNYKAKNSRLPDINFTNLYGDSHGRRKFEKFKCIINYFKRVTDNMPTGTVTYARQMEMKGADFWSGLDKKFTNLHVSTSGTIEDDGRGMLQADFANKYVGGGVLGHGLVQEEIRFLICPEMILSRLFTEVLTDYEVLIMTGCERFNNYEGYSETFKFSGNHEDTTERDEWGRICTEVVAMDALVFRSYKSQFEKEKVFRELNKAYCAFKGNQFSNHLPAVCTGNWGCGAFGGDKQLKALIQLMAASAVDRDICYFTFGDAKLCDQLGQIHDILREDGIRIKNILELIKTYSDKLNNHKDKYESLFEYIAKMLGRPIEYPETDQEACSQNYNDDNEAVPSSSMEWDTEEDYKNNTP